jgi:hypothetical protein
MDRRNRRRRQPHPGELRRALTIDDARTGIDHLTGSIEVGKRARTPWYRWDMAFNDDGAQLGI